MNRPQNRRAGYTLIELLVAMGLAIVLLSIAIAVANSSAFESYKVVGAGDKLSQMLLTSKSRAQRDGAPRGVRLIANAGFVTEMQYIETPEPMFLESPVTFPVPSSPNIPIPKSQFVLQYPEAGGIAARKAYLVLTQNDFNRFVAEVFRGDTVFAPDINAAFVINNVTPGTTGLSPTFAGSGVVSYIVDIAASNITVPDLGAGYTPTLPAANAKQGTYATTNFGIHHSSTSSSGGGSRPLLGEPNVPLPREMVVDLSTSTSNPSKSNSLGVPIGATSFDIVFGPSGQVMGTSEPLLVFAVRNPRKFAGTFDIYNSANIANAGEMVLVSITTRTGTIATKPVAQSGDPFLFAKDGINSGL